MGYEESLLATGERTIRTERQHWMFPLIIAGRWVAIAAVVFVVGFLLAFFVKGNGNGGVVDGLLNLINTVIWLVTYVALAIAVVGLVWSAIQWRSQLYVLTDRRVIHLRGVVNKQSLDSSLENITDVQIVSPWLGRIAGFGDLKLMTPAEAGVSQLRCLKDAIGFKKSLMDAKQERLLEINSPRVMPSPPLRTATEPQVGASTAPSSGMAVAAPAAAMSAMPTPVAAAGLTTPVTPTPVTPAGAAEPAAETGSPSVPADEVAHALETLAELRDKGAITPEDYEAKKAELLSRI